MTSTSHVPRPTASRSSSPVRPRQPALERSYLLWILIRTVVGTLVLVAAVQILTPGYGFGYGEQTVLSLKGISWADDTALVNDWFNDFAPQPHVLFDVITFLGESVGRLPEVYFAYWLASLAVVALATTLLAERWLPGPLRNLEFAVLVLLVAGPYFALGTFLVVHREAVPNGLGGALGLLAAVLLIRRSWRAAAVVGLLTTLVHIQHGTVVALLLLVAYVLSPDRRATRWYPAVIALFGAIVLVVSLQRGLFAGNSSFSEICETASTGHCNPEAWSSAVVWGGGLLLVLGAVAPLLARQVDRLTLGLVAVPAVLVLCGLASDLWDVPVLADLSRRVFIYRFVMLVAPFAAWSIVLAFSRVVDGLRGAVVAAAGLFVLSWYLELPWASLALSPPAVQPVLARGWLLGGLASVVVAALAWLLAARPWPVRSALAVGLAAALPVTSLWMGIRQLDQNRLSVGYRPDDTLPAFAEDLAATTPVGAVLAVQPDLSWFPLLTRRAVVATCKLIPYGGEPWHQYRQRLAALGVPGEYGVCSPDGYFALSAEQLAELRPRFGATHVVVTPQNAAYGEILREWPVVWQSGGTMQWVVAEIPEERSA